MNKLNDQEHSEQTTGGTVGALAGKAKQVVGSLVGNKDLAREGRLQQAQAVAEAEAARRASEAKQREHEADLTDQKTEIDLERQRLQNQLAEREREQRIERDRRDAERETQAKAQREQADAERQRKAQDAAADGAEQRAEQERLEVAKEAIGLEQQARAAESKANTIDPKERQ